MAAENDDIPFQFGVQNTMEMGLGNAELLQNLIAPESATEDPENVEKIIKEVEEVEKKPKPAKIKEISPTDEKPSNQDILKDFLEETDEEDPLETTKLPETSKEETEVEETSWATTLAKDLEKLGVFTKDEGEEDIVIKTPEEFLDRFRAETQKGATQMVDAFIGRLGEDYQNMFEAIFIKGVRPKDYLAIYDKVVSFAELDLTKEDNQVKVMRQSLTDQGLDPEDVESEIERLKTYADLESTSLKHHKVLVKKEALKLQEIEQKSEHELQQKAAIRNQYIQNVQKILQDKLKTKEFDGIPINPKLVNELQDFLLVDKYKTSSGETLTDFDKAILELKRPENHTQKVKVALLLKLLETDPTLSTIQKAGISKKSDLLFTETARQRTSIVTPPNTQKKSWF